MTIGVIPLEPTIILLTFNVLRSFSGQYARFLKTTGIEGWLSLSEVVLSITGTVSKLYNQLKSCGINFPM
jgi:K+ transporter